MRTSYINMCIMCKSRCKRFAVKFVIIAKIHHNYRISRSKSLKYPVWMIQVSDNTAILNEKFEKIHFQIIFTQLLRLNILEIRKL